MLELFDHETWEVLVRAATTTRDPNLLAPIRPELAEQVVPPVDLFCRLYFRQEIDGIDEVPEGPALLVMNHEAGISFVQVLGMAARWHGRRGDPMVPLTHDAMFKIPLVGNLLAAFGAIRASHENAERALAEGVKVLVSPGGNVEAFRPYRERNRIKFAGHKGWARLALRAGVPIVPVVFAGGQETFFVLHDGQPLVKWLGLKRLLRIDTFPIFLGLPWGLGLGPLFHLPLPAKSTVRFLPALTLDQTGPDAAEDQGQVDALYERVTSQMQAALDEMAARRRLPVLG